MSDTDSNASDSSIYSQPSEQPCGFRSFKISAILSDPILQQQLQLQNPRLKAGLLAAWMLTQMQVFLSSIWHQIGWMSTTT